LLTAERELRKREDGEDGEAGPGQGPRLLLALPVLQRLRLHTFRGGRRRGRGQRAEGPGEQPAAGAGEAQGFRRWSRQDSCFPSGAKGRQDSDMFRGIC